MLTVTDYAKLVTDEKGKLQLLGVAAALSSLKAWPLLQILTFVPKTGTSYTANFGTASAAAATRAMNAAFTESAPGVDASTLPMRAAGGEMKFDINMLAQDNTGAVRAGMLTQKLIDIGARLNRMWFKGDKDAGSGAEWHGADEFCADMGAQVEQAANGAVVSAAKMDELLSLVPGANVIVCNRTLASAVNALDQGVQKTVVVNQGVSPDLFRKNYKGVPILEVLTAPDDTTATRAEILDFDETQGTSNVCSRITAARIGMDGVYGIQGGPMSLLAPRPAGAFEIQDLNWFMAGLVSDYTDAIAQLIGVKAA